MSVYRWAFGHVSYTTLTTDATAVVSAFPNTGHPNPWLFQTNGAISRYARRVVTPSLKAYAIGGNDTSWNFQVLNFEQYQWLMDNRFDGGQPSALATIMTYRTNPPSATGISTGWVAMQCTALLETTLTIDSLTNYNDFWLGDVVVRFVRGTLIGAP